MRKFNYLLCLTFFCPPLFAQSFQWASHLGGIVEDKGTAVAKDAAGNVYTTGAFEYSADFDPGPGEFKIQSNGGTDLFVCKLDPDGHFLWAKSLGWTYDEWGYDLAADPAGNVYVTGAFRGPLDFNPSPNEVFEMDAVSTADIFVLKLDPNGNFLWAKQLGGASSGYGYTLTVDATGNVFTAGYFFDTFDFDPGPGVYELTSGLFCHNGFISKLDTDGNFVWAKNIGGYNYDNLVMRDISLDTAGNVYTTGDFRNQVDFDPGPGNFSYLALAESIDGFVLKLNSSGDFVWARRIGGIKADRGSSIAVDLAGNVYTTGDFEGSCNFHQNANTPYSLQSVGGYDFFISKMDANGKFVWAKSIGQSSHDWAQSIALDAVGNVYATGQFLNTADFDPGPGVANLSSEGNYDIFILKLNPDGEYMWAKSIGGTAADGGESILIDPDNQIFLAGFFRNFCDFDPGDGSHHVTANGLQDAFVLKLGQPGVGTEDSASTPSSVPVYPNPASEEIWLSVPVSHPVQITVYDLLGKPIQTNKANSGEIRIPVQDFTPGVYHLHISDGQRVWSARFLR